MAGERHTAGRNALVGPLDWVSRLAPAPASTAVPPRPMGAIELLDEGFRVLRGEFATIAPIVAGAAAPLALISAFAARQGNGTKSGLDHIGSGLIGTFGVDGNWVIALFLVAFLWPAFVAGPVCRITVAHWAGREETRRSALKDGMRRIPALLVAIILVDLMVAAGALLLIVPALGAWVVFHLTVPAIAVEGKGPFAGIRRSASLVSRQFWRVFAVSTLSVVISSAVGLLLRFVPSGAAGLMGFHWGFLLLAVASLVSQTVTWSWSMIVVTLIYLDAQARSEGLDLVIRASRAAEGELSVGSAVPGSTTSR